MDQEKIIKTYQLGVRITETLRQKIEKLARADNRVFSDYIRIILSEHVNNKEKD